LGLPALFFQLHQQRRSVFLLFQILLTGHFRNAHADTDISGTAISGSSFTLSGNVIVSTLSVTSMSVSTITVVSSATITNLSVGNLTTSAVLGRIKQFVYGSNTTATGTTSSTFQSTSLSASITPTSTSSTIWVFVTGTIRTETLDNTANASIFNGSTNLCNATNGCNELRGVRAGNTITPASMIAMQAPGSVSTQTYTVKIKSADGSGSVDWGNGSTQSMLLVEFL